MKIKITLGKEEVKDIIKKHVFKEFPINTENQEVYVTESFGEYKVEIEKKIEPAKEEDADKSTNEKEEEKSND